MCSIILLLYYLGTAGFLITPTLTTFRHAAHVLVELAIPAEKYAKLIGHGREEEARVTSEERESWRRLLEDVVSVAESSS